MKTLYIDIETSPNLAHVWDIWNQNVGINQLMDVTQVLCFAAKWEGDDKMFYHSIITNYHHEMVEAAWRLLDEADAVVHYNGIRFDVPHLNREFLEANMGPPSSFKQIDLLQTVKKQFKFPSNKLQYVSQALGIGEKVKHPGHELWVKCLNGDREAWALMKQYNIQDVILLTELYHKLLPWIKGHPNVALFEEGDKDGENPICPRCGGEDVTRQGFAYTGVSKFQQYKCKECRAWFRGRHNVADRAQLGTNIAG